MWHACLIKRISRHSIARNYVIHFSAMYNNIWRDLFGYIYYENFLFFFFSGVGPYDIGLLKLERPLNFSDEVQSVQLPQAESDPKGEAILCGWGSTERGTPDKLQHVDVVYIDLQTCYDAVKRLTGSSPVHETNVCSGPLSDGISACSVSIERNLRIIFCSHLSMLLMCTVLIS